MTAKNVITRFRPALRSTSPIPIPSNFLVEAEGKKFSITATHLDCLRLVAEMVRKQAGVRRFAIIVRHLYRRQPEPEPTIDSRLQVDSHLAALDCFEQVLHTPAADIELCAILEKNGRASTGQRMDL